MSNLEVKSNNSRAFSPFTLRLPRFEFSSPAYAEVVLEVTDCCGDEPYPYDRRLTNEGLCPEPVTLEEEEE